MRKALLISMIFYAFLGCKSQQLNKERAVAGKPSEEAQFVSALPHIVIYKTTKNYNHNVPVLISEDKTQIVSYPHPTDLFLGNNLALPSLLHKGYLLDNRGIQKNVAFLKYTYEEYSKLKDVPSLEELQRNIVDNDPLTELWDCGESTNFNDLQKQLNECIDKDMLSKKFNRIK